MKPSVAPRPERDDLPGAGLRLAADRWGAPGDDVVVFLHGAGQSRRAWDDTARAVAENGWHAVTVDHRGHGDSDWPAEPDYDWDHFADDVTAIVEHLDATPVLVGASLGGMSALLAQARADDQLFRAVVLVDVTPRMELRGVQRIVGFMAAHPDGFDSLEAASEIIAEYTGRPRPPTSDGLSQVLRKSSDGRWRWRWDIRFLDGRAELILDGDLDALRASQMRERLHDGARRIRVPTLVVRGANSDLVSAEGVEEFVHAVPGARYADVAGAGHMVAGDQNDQFTAAVLEFLRDLRGAARTR
ncbi:MAG: alpha/beta hydrolase [Microthrixaceae bacterium]|nr:alpha/beta hydrolase [Microthrixaceae bacterium]